MTRARSLYRSRARPGKIRPLEELHWWF
uniref:Uncharacterized protein n=1 Tax=Arundo donax TaxID=35708 RepID=A0A0A9E372_ARUDO